MEVRGPQGAVTADTPEADQTRRIVGRVNNDGLPRVIEINRYTMDMVPEGEMILLQNEDRPGMIGLVGTEFGNKGVNIADMAISRRDLGTGEPTALMTMKIDSQPPADFISHMLDQPGILKVASVKLPPVK